MNDELQLWLNQELDNRHWSQREFARQIGFSNSFVSKILAGTKSPSINFCHRAAEVLDVSPAYILQLAGILPDEPTPTAPGPVTAEILKVVEGLTSEQRHQVLDYARYIAQQGRNSNS